MYFFQELLNQKRSVQNAFDDKSLLKLIFTTRPERCTVALGTSTCCQLQPSSQSLSGLSPTKGSHTSLSRDENPGNEVAVNFFHLRKRKSPLQHTVDNEVSALY